MTTVAPLLVTGLHDVFGAGLHDEVQDEPIMDQGSQPVHCERFLECEHYLICGGRGEECRMVNGEW